MALVTDAFGGAGGIACYNRDLVKSMAGMEPVQAIRILPRYGPALEVDANVRQVKARSGRLAYSVAALTEVWRFRPDRIFCGHLFMLPLAAFIGRVTGIPVWLQLHGIEAWTRPSRAVCRALRWVDVVTCVSRYTRQRFLNWADLDPAIVRVLPNTVSDSFAPRDRSVCRAAFNVGGGPVLLTVGRLATSERYKGHDRVLRCLPELSRTHPSLVYLVAGTGDDRGRLEQLATDLGVAGAVHFLGDVPFDTLPALFNAADLFVMPSTGEGFGIVYLESMACGTPALGLDVDGSRDPLRDGELGLIAAEEGLLTAIGAALASARPDNLAFRVHDLFGPAAFGRQVGRLIDHMASTRVAATCAA